MNANDNLQPTLFISYCWNDGNVYADELEAQLTDYFDVKRDKSQLIVNDDIRKKQKVHSKIILFKRYKNNYASYRRLT